MSVFELWFTVAYQSLSVWIVLNLPQYGHLTSVCSLSFPSTTYVGLSPSTDEVQIHSADVC
eukprot:Gb_18912 [translate_table: standard]